MATKVDYQRTKESVNRITDANLKVTAALFVPDFTGGDPSLNNNPDEAGAVGYQDDKLLVYIGDDNWKALAMNDDLVGETSARTAADLTKVDKVDGYGLSQENFTTSDKNKLATLSEHYKGTYTTTGALATANPTGNPGDYAFVDTGTGEDAKMYIWDDNDVQWVLSSGSGIIPDATEMNEGIIALATLSQALDGTDDARAMTALKTLAVILDRAKTVDYQINPVGLNEVSIYMENDGQVNNVLVSGATDVRLKIGLTGTYPSGAQTYPFDYSAGDRLFITFNYSDLLNASCNVKLKCQDN